MKKKIIAVIAISLIMIMTLVACGSNSGGTSGKQTATAWLSNESKRVSTTVELTGGWSVEFAPGACYIFDKEIKEDEDTECIAMGLTLDQEVYDDHYNDHKDSESFEEKDGICSFKDELDGSTDYLFMADGDVPFLLDVIGDADGAAILARLSFKKDV